MQLPGPKETKRDGALWQTSGLPGVADTRREMATGEDGLCLIKPAVALISGR